MCFNHTHFAVHNCSSSDSVNLAHMCSSLGPLCNRTGSGTHAGLLKAESQTDTTGRTNLERGSNCSQHNAATWDNTQKKYLNGSFHAHCLYVSVYHSAVKKPRHKCFRRPGVKIEIQSVHGVSCHKEKAKVSKIMIVSVNSFLTLKDLTLIEWVFSEYFLGILHFCILGNITRLINQIII